MATSSLVSRTGAADACSEAGRAEWMATQSGQWSVVADCSWLGWIWQASTVDAPRIRSRHRTAAQRIGKLIRRRVKSPKSGKNRHIYMVKLPQSLASQQKASQQKARPERMRSQSPGRGILPFQRSFAPKKRPFAPIFRQSVCADGYLSLVSPRASKPRGQCLVSGLEFRVSNPRYRSV